MSLHDPYDDLAAQARQERPRSLVTAPWLDELDLHTTPWRHHELDEDETITGRLLRKPTAGSFCGSFVFIGNPDEAVGMKATAKTGHTVLERELTGVDIGDLVEITYHGKRITRNGEREYRHYEVNRIDP